MAKRRKFLTVTEAALILRKSPETIRRYIRIGKIRAKKVRIFGTAIYIIPVSEVERLLREKKRK